MKELTYHHDGCGLTERCVVTILDDPHPVNGANHRYGLARVLDHDECAGWPGLISPLQFDDPPHAFVPGPAEQGWEKQCAYCPPGGDRHCGYSESEHPRCYEITLPGVAVGEIQFQRGPRNVAGSTPGTLDGAVISVLIHRQECFQAGPFACPENEAILGHLREALRLTIERAQERAKRGVLGRNEK